jgi:hypothetical protein
LIHEIAGTTLLRRFWGIQQASYLFSAVRKEVEVAPNLISLDHHTDSHPPFLRHVCRQIVARGGDQEEETVRANLVSEVRWQDDSSVRSAIEKLQHDEHIQTATLAGIINYTFVIHLDGSGGTPISNNNSSIPEGRIFLVPHDCFIGCERRSHDDECWRTHSNQVLETSYLDDQLQKAREMTTYVGILDIEESWYVLDIDLDFFHTERALNPESPEVFHRLIRKATAITIAKEPACTADLWLDPPIDIRIMLEWVIEHIREACAT